MAVRSTSSASNVPYQLGISGYSLLDRGGIGKQLRRLRVPFFVRCDQMSVSLSDMARVQVALL